MKELPVHIVTKILIVFCAILSLLLSALTIAYVGNNTALVQSVKGLQSRVAAAEAAAANEISQGAQEKAVQGERLTAIQNELATRIKSINELESERTTLRSENQQSKADAASIRNQIAQLGATTDTQAAMIKAYRDEVTTLREALLSAQKREIELVDRVNDLDSAREVLEQNARALKEQLEESKLKLAQAQQTATGGGLVARAAESTPREIVGNVLRARVDEIFRSPTGDTMVVISEGSNRGIKENALMHIIRGTDEFVGSVVITVVEPGRSVGKLNSYGRGNTVQVNDTVLSRLN
jgi:cell shape-determining protein MreC